MVMAFLLIVFLSAAFLAMMCTIIRKLRTKGVSGAYGKRTGVAERLFEEPFSDDSTISDGPRSFFLNCCRTFLKLGILTAYVMLETASVLLWAHAHGNEEEIMGPLQLVGLAGFENRHYRMDESGKTWWFPVDGCKLAVPQPFWLILALGTSKAFIFYRLFKATNVGCHDNKDWIITMTLSTYQCVTFLRSLGSTICFVFHLSDISGFHRYECLGLAVNATSWDTNALMLFVKWHIRSFKGEWLLSQQDGLDRCRDQFMKWMALLCGASWLVLNCGIVFSHIMVGIVLFFPTTATIMILSVVSVIIVATIQGRPDIILIFCPEECPPQNEIDYLFGGAAEADAVEKDVKHWDRRDGLLIQAERRYARDSPEMQKIKRWEQMQLISRDKTFQKYYDRRPLTLVAAILLFAVGIQMIATQVTYFYNGLAWWECIWVSISERQISLYLKNLWGTVVSTCASQPWFPDFLNEAT